MTVDRANGVDGGGTGKLKGPSIVMDDHEPSPLTATVASEDHSSVSHSVYGFADVVAAESVIPVFAYYLGQ